MSTCIEVEDETYMIIRHLLAQDEIKFGVEVLIRLLILWSEDDHYAVLEEVVESNGVRVETLAFQVMGPDQLMSEVRL